MRNSAAEIPLHDSLFMWPLLEPSYNMHMAKQCWLSAPHVFFQWSTQNPDLCEHDVVLVVRDKEVSSLLVYHTSRFTSFQGHRSNTPICKHTTHAAKRLDPSSSTVNSRWPGWQIVARWLLKSDFALVHLYLSCPSGERVGLQGMDSWSHFREG